MQHFWQMGRTRPALTLYALAIGFSLLLLSRVRVYVPDNLSSDTRRFRAISTYVPPSPRISRVENSRHDDDFIWRIPITNPLKSWPSWSSAATTDLTPIRARKHIAIATSFGPHFEVYVPLAWTMKKLVGESGSVQIYTDSLGGDYGITTQDSGMYDVKGSGLRSPDLLVGDVTNKSMFTTGAGGGDMIDMIVFGTCELDLPKWTPELIEAWDARPDDQKFVVVCIVHNAGDSRWLEATAGEWSKRNALRLLPMAEHVQAAFQSQLKDLADKHSLRDLLYEYVKVDVHYCVAPTPSLPKEERVYQGSKGLAHAAILGNLQVWRRDYYGTFADLQDSLERNASAWGYIKKEGKYLPDPNSALTPFQLHLIGSGEVTVPEDIKELIKIHSGLPYPKFYALIQSMDVIMPAFAEGGSGYFHSQGSSAVHTAAQCNVPMLGTRRLRDAYKYVDDDRIVVHRPQGVNEINALMALRTGSSAKVPNEHRSKRLQHDIDEMIRGGWQRPEANFAQIKAELWEHNEEIVWRLLRDL